MWLKIHDAGNGTIRKLNHIDLTGHRGYTFSHFYGELSVEWLTSRFFILRGFYCSVLEPLYLAHERTKLFPTVHIPDIHFRVFGPHLSSSFLSTTKNLKNQTKNQRSNSSRGQRLPPSSLRTSIRKKNPIPTSGNRTFFSSLPNSYSPLCLHVTHTHTGSFFTDTGTLPGSWGENLKGGLVRSVVRCFSEQGTPEWM